MLVLTERSWTDLVCISVNYVRLDGNQSSELLKSLLFY